MRWVFFCLAFWELAVSAMPPAPVWTDAIKPIWYWLRAASYGDSYAAKEVGDYYMAGHYVGAIRGDKAVFWYRYAAHHANAQAALVLGRLYWYGEYGVPKRHGLALHWLYRSAILGNADAQQTWVNAIQLSEHKWRSEYPDHARLSPISLIHAKALVPEAVANFQQGLLCQYLPSLHCQSQALHWYRRAWLLRYEPAKLQIDSLSYDQIIKNKH